MNNCEMEMPVPCDKCGRWVELNSTIESRLDNGKMYCVDCHTSDYLAKEKIDEIRDIQWMLDNNDPEVKGDRRGWKKNIKDLRREISELGYNADEYL